jgi:23S rRNA (cytosine1962-C5)-methyltransferase
MKIWRLNRGADRRFRQGHPWIFASEVAHSIKEVQPGEVVELRDAQDHFLAFGYAHPSSQICFRRLSSRSKDRDVLSVEFFTERLRAARRERVRAGWAQTSHRWVYAEADGVPGLIVDAFLRAEGGWLVVVQASTAGIERALSQLYEALAAFAGEFGEMCVIEAPSSKARSFEGLAVAGKKVVRGEAGDLRDCAIRLHHDLVLRCDLLNGQKTGFFLDQQWNAGLLRRFVRGQFVDVDRPVRVLDICCYVGQWGAHVAHELQGAGRPCEVTLVDVSSAALELASTNVRTVGAEARVIAGDALTAVGEFEGGSFDIVICDPPAFVKKRADLPQGLKAYAKLNRDAMRAVAAGGLFVASSCSGLVRGDDWRDVLVQAGQKAGRMFKQLARGGHGPDHPVRAEFPEGEYLKCEIGLIEYPY